MPDLQRKHKWIQWIFPWHSRLTINRFAIEEQITLPGVTKGGKEQNTRHQNF